MPGKTRIPRFRGGPHDGGPLSAQQRALLAAHIELCSVPEPNSGCWLWLGAVNKPELRARLECFGEKYAARLAYRAFLGECDGTQVLHDCDNPSCVNPDHLHTGSQRANMRECIARGRFCFNHAKRGSCHHGSKLTEESALAIKRRLASGEKRSALSREFGVTYFTVRDIEIGRIWGWL